MMEMEAGAIMLEMPTLARFCSDLAPATLARLSAPPMGSGGWLDWDWDWDRRDDLGAAPTPGVGGTSRARGPGTVWARWVGRVSSLTSASARDKTLTL
jgi:hypothetical protein